LQQAGRSLADHGDRFAGGDPDLFSWERKTVASAISEVPSS